MKTVDTCTLGRVLRSLFLASVLIAPLAQGQTIQAVTETTRYAYLKGDRVEGPATQVVEKTLLAAGLQDYQIKLYPWARTYDMALNIPNVLIYLIARTTVREQQFQWVGEVISIPYHLYRLRTRTEIRVANLMEAQNYTIGVMRDDVRHQYLQSKGFTRLVVSGQQLDNFNKLINAQVDLVPLSEGDASSLCTQVQALCPGLEPVLTLDEISTGMYMAYSKTTPDTIVRKTRAAFDKLKQDGTVGQIMGRKS